MVETRDDLDQVDLPAPFSPTGAWIEPEWSVRLPDRGAITWPNAFETSRSSRVGILITGWLRHLPGFPSIVWPLCLSLKRCGDPSRGR